MLFDDEEQLEVRHVISLAHHDVSIYSGGDVTPEGELYIKRNAIRLSRRNEAYDIASENAKPFYLFSENCSAKEDFYFALLRNQEQTLAADRTAPVPLQYDVTDIISLVQRLHSTDDHLHTRWLNALLGRVFLSVYKTYELENFIREKLTKKISRVKRPSFLTHIVIRDIHTGNSPPYISNPKLRDLSVDGECVVEADVRYTGNFRIEVSTTARIDLGSRFKAREVDLTLAVVLRRIEGRAMFKIKAPPSNRIWFSFQSMPKMEMSIEPIVSSRQITYTMILRQIENRIKEVVAESIVSPFWDDVPFFDTEHKKWRGGIWASDNQPSTPPPEEVIDAPPVNDPCGHDVQFALDVSDPKHPHIIEKHGAETPPLVKSPTASLFSRKLTTKSAVSSPRASTTSFESTQHVPATASAWPAPSRTAADVVVAPDSAKAEPAAGIREMPTSAAMETLAAVAGSPPKQGMTPLALPIKPPPPVAKAHSIHSDRDGDRNREREHEEDTVPVPVPTTTTTSHENRRDTTSSIESFDHGHATNQGKAASVKSRAGSTNSNSRGFPNREETGTSFGSSNSNSSTGHNSNGTSTVKNNTFAAVSNAAQQARQWGLNALQRRREAKEEQQKQNQLNHHHNSNGHPQVDLSQPMGRGRPLPPPGIPLPPPDRSQKPTTIPVQKKRTLPPPLLPERWWPGPGDRDRDRDREREREREWEQEVQKAKEMSLEDEQHKSKRPVPPPPLPRRRGRNDSVDDYPPEGNMLVVAAPSDSEPGTPAAAAGEAFPSLDSAVQPADVDEGSKVIPTQQADARPPPLPPKQVPVAEEVEVHDVQDTPAQPQAESSDAAPSAVTQNNEEEDDDGYSGWMDDTMTFEEEENENVRQAAIIAETNLL